MLGPDPADKIVGIVLIFGEPQFALLSDDVEDLVHMLC